MEREAILLNLITPQGAELQQLSFFIRIFCAGQKRIYCCWLGDTTTELFILAESFNNFRKGGSA